MARIRASTLLMLAALQASFAQALGLGDISLNSALDEPLSADIRLRGMGDLNALQILVNLASSADFERSGVERPLSLSGMRFDIEVLKNGEGVIHVSTDRPVKEPYLDFIIDVRWPNGRVLREYTVLLDPPLYTSAAVPAVSAPATPRSSGASRSSDSTRVSSDRGSWSGDSYEVASGDTLWSIANRVRPAGVSIQRMMVALHDNNPDAFIRGNINLLRSGRVLRIPGPSEIEVLSQDQAASTVSAHDRDWRDGAAATPQPEPVAAATEAAGAAPAAPDDEAYLRLAGEGAGSSAASGSGSEAGGDTAVTLNDELATVRENLSAAELTNADLETRVKALEQQVEGYKELVEIKNDGLAATGQSAAASLAAAKPEQAAPAAGEPSAQPQKQTGLIDTLLGNVWALGAVVALLLGAMVAFLFMRRRTVEEFPVVARREMAVTRKVTPAAPAVQEITTRAAEPPREEVVKPVVAAVVAPAVVAAAAAEPELRDPVSEADIYLAYGRHERAIELLNTALTKDPRDNRARLKLLEIFADQDDQARFVGGYDVLKSSGDVATLSAARDLVAGGRHEHWLLDSEAASAGDSLPSPEMAGLEQDDPEVATIEVEGSTLELDADFTLEPELAESGAAAEGTISLDEEFGELELDELEGKTADLDAVPTTSDVPPAAAEFGEFELGSLELEPDVEAEPATTQASAAVEDTDLDMLSGTDEIETKLELARAYVDMGDMDGARDILEEVMAEGTQQQLETAREMLERIGGG